MPISVSGTLAEFSAAYREFRSWLVFGIVEQLYNPRFPDVDCRRSCSRKCTSVHFRVGLRLLCKYAKLLSTANTANSPRKLRQSVPPTQTSRPAANTAISPRKLRQSVPPAQTIHLPPQPVDDPQKPLRFFPRLPALRNQIQSHLEHMKHAVINGQTNFASRPPRFPGSLHTVT